jgi:DNA primase
MSMAGEWVDYRAVKAAVSLEQVLRSYGVDGLRSRRPGQLEGRCPIHRGGRKDAFHVSLSRNAFQCFACQAHGNVLDLVAALEQCSVREAALRLARRFPVPAGGPGVVQAAPVGVAGGERSNWLGKKEGSNPPLSFTLRGVDGSHPYLKTRGILPDTAARFGVGFYAGGGMMSGRVVIPIHDGHGQLVAYAGRSVDGTAPKYRLPAGFRKSQVLFNFHRATGPEQRCLVVVEGYFDCLKVHQAGFPGVAALMGTVLFPLPQKLLLERFQRVILMLDGDESGRQATHRIGAQLVGQCSVQLVAVPAGRQPDQMTEEEIRALLGAVLVGDREMR